MNQTSDSQQIVRGIQWVAYSVSFSHTNKHGVPLLEMLLPEIQSDLFIQCCQQTYMIRLKNKHIVGS